LARIGFGDQVRLHDAPHKSAQLIASRRRLSFCGLTLGFGYRLFEQIAGD